MKLRINSNGCHWLVLFAWLKVHGWCLHVQAACYSVEGLLPRLFCLVAAFGAWKTGLESQEKCRSKCVFSPFEALQQKKCQAVLEGCLLVSCFCICWCISLAKTNRGPKDTLNFHFWVWARQVKSALFSVIPRNPPSIFELECRAWKALQMSISCFCWFLLLLEKQADYSFLQFEFWIQIEQKALMENGLEMLSAEKVTLEQGAAPRSIWTGWVPWERQQDQPKHPTSI